MHSLPSPQSSLGGGTGPIGTSSPPPGGTPGGGFRGNNNNANSGPGGGVPRTRDLIETSPFLFAPNLAGGNLHYHP